MGHEARGPCAHLAVFWCAGLSDLRDDLPPEVTGREAGGLGL